MISLYVWYVTHQQKPLTFSLNQKTYQKHVLLRSFHHDHRQETFVWMVAKSCTRQGNYYSRTI